jgi:hypothetical protein
MSGELLHRPGKIRLIVSRSNLAAAALVIEIQARLSFAGAGEKKRKHPSRASYGGKSRSVPRRIRWTRMAFGAQEVV